MGEARAMVRVGELLDSSALPAVSNAVAAGELSVLAADAIRSGLGEPAGEITARGHKTTLLVSVKPGQLQGAPHRRMAA